MYAYSFEWIDGSDYIERYNTMNTLFEGTSMERYVINLSNGDLDDSSVIPLVPIQEQPGYSNGNDIDDIDDINDIDDGEQTGDEL